MTQTLNSFKMKKILFLFPVLALVSCYNAEHNCKDFKNGKAVKESCIKINSYENIADDVLSQATVKLFETNDAINIIKIK